MWTLNAIVESSGESLDVSNAIDVNTHRSLPLQRRLRIVQYVGPVIAHAIAEERDKRGPYKVSVFAYARTHLFALFVSLLRLHMIFFSNSFEHLGVDHKK